MTTITKAIIPAAGFGTRMLPAATAVPKELLPILDRPTIQYVLEEAAAAGITESILITAKGKEAIESHFKPNADLIERLRSTGKADLLSSIHALTAKMRISSVIQPTQAGLGDAVLQAKRAVGNEPFLCLLGDTIFTGDTLPARQLLDAYAKLGTSIIALEEVPLEKVSRYGICSGPQISQGLFKLDTVIEKPSPDSTPSRLAIAARYILTPAIFDCLEKTPKGRGGELQLTDAIRLLLTRQPVHGLVLSSKRHDIGNPLDWLKTNLIFAHRDPKLWPQIEPLLRSMLS